MKLPRSPFEKTICAIFALFVLALSSSLKAQEVKIGETKAQVLKTLGIPKGAISEGKTEVLSYDRGEILLSEGKVVNLEWLPEGVTYSAIGQREVAVQAEQIQNLTKIKTAEAEYEAQKVRLEEEKTRQADYDKRLSQAYDEIDRLQKKVDDLEGQNANLITQSNYLSWQLFYNPRPCPKPVPPHPSTNCPPAQTASK